MTPSFDFVVIGAGSAGCAVAAGLAQNQNGTIAVIEAGPSDSHPFVKIPFALIWTMGSRKRDWRFQSAPQKGLNGRTLAIPRGKMLGGSGSINSMVWFRGTAADFDGWQTPGLAWADARPAFEATEAKLTPAPLPNPHPTTQRLFNLFCNSGGTLRMGTDDTAPVTPRLALRGVQSLWVADASVMPAVTSANTNAPSMMIGHRAAQMITQDAA
jgi:choline dehydrogenase